MNYVKKILYFDKCHVIKLKFYSVKNSTFAVYQKQNLGCFFFKKSPYGSKKLKVIIIQGEI